MIFCSAKDVPWDCVKEESSRLLDTWMNNLYIQWETLKGKTYKTIIYEFLCK